MSCIVLSARDIAVKKDTKISAIMKPASKRGGEIDNPI